MLKIVEVRPAPYAQGEYIVLQNVGLVTLSLRGWALCTDAYMAGEAERLSDEMYIFRDDVPIKPYTRVVLFTGGGDDGWVPTIDGRQAYCAYWDRAEGVWIRTESVHILHVAASRRVAEPTLSAVAAAA